mmetsp:Transcript_34788/g.62650  ORF Transcript_34788/g.62650 Transcript_34788/m.62650 type:complete len:137 (+) Transcript_34788:236-646(+)
MGMGRNLGTTTTTTTITKTTTTANETTKLIRSQSLGPTRSLTSFTRQGLQSLIPHNWVKRVQQQDKQLPKLWRQDFTDRLPLRAVQVSHPPVSQKGLEPLALKEIEASAAAWPGAAPGVVPDGKDIRTDPAGEEVA